MGNDARPSLELYDYYRPIAAIKGDVEMVQRKNKKALPVFSRIAEHFQYFKKYPWLIWLFPLIGLGSLIWFLLRVVPKPSRATYPCQRVAGPLAGGFVVWITGLIASTIAYHKAKQLFHQSRYVLAGICVAVAVMAIWWSLSITGGVPANADFTPTDPPNTPIGMAKGIHPGRVVWVHEPNATSWNGSTGYWWDNDNTDQQVVDVMVAIAVRRLTGEPNHANAWDALFRHFNQTRGLGDIGYQQGEKVTIKINMNQDNGGNWHNDDGMPSPHVIYSFLDQLVNIVGVPGSAITIYDASRYIGNPIYNKVRSNPNPNFQSITFVVSPHYAGSGRIAATRDLNPNNLIRFSNGATNANLPQCVTQAKYLINMALLRPHSLFGITLCAKNHFGSVYCGGWTPSPLHDYGRRESNMGSYNCLVDLIGHEHLGGKTLLYMIDGLYPASNQGGSVIRWESFEGDWCSSIFASQDPVAIDSVALDFMRNEPRCYDVTGYPDNYLHEAALANAPPSGIYYDPEGDGTRLAGLGVHEHWNNATEKQYSRNLGTGNGIELWRGSLAPDVDFSDDGIVNFVDYSKLVYYWQQSHAMVDVGPPPDGDGIIDSKDLTVLAENWLRVTTIPPLPEPASSPNPADGATEVSRTLDLNWTAGVGAASHDVYIGWSDPPPFRCNQTDTRFQGGTLAPGTTYYWRIDERNEWGTTEGPLWSFTTTTGP